MNEQCSGRTGEKWDSNFGDSIYEDYIEIGYHRGQEEKEQGT